MCTEAKFLHSVLENAERPDVERWYDEQHRECFFVLFCFSKHINIMKLFPVGGTKPTGCRQRLLSADRDITLA